LSIELVQIYFFTYENKHAKDFGPSVKNMHSPYGNQSSGFAATFEESADCAQLSSLDDSNLQISAFK